MGRNKEVYDTELCAILVGPAAARDHKEEWEALLDELGGPKLIPILTDSQAALKRIRN
jgi:hypothetical protein